MRAVARLKPPALLARLPAAVDQRVDSTQLVEDGGGIDDGDQVVQARDVAQAGARRLVLEGERLCDGQRLLCEKGQDV